MTDLLKLAERVEAATAGGWELDEDILGVVNPVALIGPGLRVPQFSTSLDAAMLLVPEEHDWLVRSDGSFANVSRKDATNFSELRPAELRPEPEVIDADAFAQGHRYGHAATPALALTAAALRAIHAMQEGTGK